MSAFPRVGAGPKMLRYPRQPCLRLMLHVAVEPCYTEPLLLSARPHSPQKLHSPNPPDTATSLPEILYTTPRLITLHHTHLFSFHLSAALPPKCPPVTAVQSTPARSSLQSESSSGDALTGDVSKSTRLDATKRATGTTSDALPAAMCQGKAFAFLRLSYPLATRAWRG
ncbi:uncharacterized protein EKO05_0010190 [Ascochyta rabiei]|uniref:uncharacterized protein n=1 Tax=Didymella rabiei TaxID=5454 RepID=UPI00220490D7|nr:uncharacterized protein EKO05_0010190 [Ascochyta rabiei]UPX19941.1 hypothetical protein EKO05_0010190 [Ascochyta rabiei]